MEHAYSILMFWFAGALAVYGLLLILTKDIGLVPRSDSSEIKDKKGYAKQLGKIVLATSLAPLSSALIAWNGRTMLALAMLFIGFAVCIREGVRMMGKFTR